MNGSYADLARIYLKRFLAQSMNGAQEHVGDLIASCSETVV